MKTCTVLILPEAEAELEGAFLWYFERSPLAADSFRAEVADAIDRLPSTANMWAPDENGIRRYVLSRFPYTVYYDYDGKTATVLAIAHQRRRPSYWPSLTNRAPEESGLTFELSGSFHLAAPGLE